MMNDLVQPQTEHPVVPFVPEGIPNYLDLVQERESIIAASLVDPYFYGFEPEQWTIADRILSGSLEIFVSGGNRAGKTEWAAKRAMKVLCEIPKSKVICCHIAEQSSLTVQQSAIWKYLPAQYKRTRKSKTAYVNYSIKNGFTDRSFILPNGSQCWFSNYTQDQKVIEGGEYDLAWCDELVPQSWVEALRYRLVTREGKLIITQTPIDGVNAVYREFVSGGRITEWAPAKYLRDRRAQENWPLGMAPRIMQSRRKTASVMWMFTENNPFNPENQLAAILELRGLNDVLCRAYGWAVEQTGRAFPRFSDIHIVPHDSIPKEGTNFMSCDPADARNWFMLWARCTPGGKIYVYREWPDSNVGEWALPAEAPDGKPGPAQRLGAGKGFVEIKAEILALEDGEEIAERYIDPRAGGSSRIQDEGGSTLIDLLAQFTDSDKGMLFFPAAAAPIKQSVSIINDWLAWKSDKDRTYLNEPKFYVSENCQNLIYSLREWTGADAEKGASKDPIDALRYLAIQQPEYYRISDMAVRGGGTY